MIDSCSSICAWLSVQHEPPSTKKRPKRDCHFDKAWIQEFQGIGVSSEVKSFFQSVDHLLLPNESAYSTLMEIPKSFLLQPVGCLTNAEGVPVFHQETATSTPRFKNVRGPSFTTGYCELEYILLEGIGYDHSYDGGVLCFVMFLHTALPAWNTGRSIRVTMTQSLTMNKSEALLPESAS
eukprot:Em0009g331a